MTCPHLYVLLPGNTKKIFYSLFECSFSATICFFAASVTLFYNSDEWLSTILQRDLLIVLTCFVGYLIKGFGKRLSYQTVRKVFGLILNYLLRKKSLWGD